MELKINIEKKHLIVFGVFVLLVVGGYAIADNWDSSKPFHETLFTDFITSKSGGHVEVDDSFKINHNGASLTIASWATGEMSITMPGVYTGDYPYGRIHFYGSQQSHDHDLSEFVVQADNITLSGNDVEITGNLKVGSCDGCGGSGSGGPACVICKSCGGDWSVVTGHFGVKWDNPDGYGEECAPPYSPDLGTESIFLCCEGEIEWVPPVGTIFITESTDDGNMDGVSGANVICQGEATDLGFSGNWIAILSADGTNVIDRITHNGEFINIKGEHLANNKNDLFDGIDNYIYTSYGATPSSNSAWTGTGSDGKHKNPDCYSWSSSGTQERGLIGNASVLNSGWIDTNTNGVCNNEVYRVYCVRNS